MTNVPHKIASALLELVATHNPIVIFHHVNPDGDCLGSQFGLKLWLQQQFPGKQIYTPGDHEGLFDFMIWEFDAPELPDWTSALAIVVDANYSNRINNAELLMQIPTRIRIDHHPESDDVNYQLRWVDPSYCASAEQVSDLIYQYQPASLTPAVAAYLYLGIYTDSGRFFYDKTSSRTHQLVAWLLATGLDIQPMHQALAQRSLRELALCQEVYSHYRTYQNVIYYVMSQAKMQELGLAPIEANRVDLLANIAGFSIWIFFIENPDGTIRVRLRSNAKNVNQLAKAYGGGGHLRASGATINNSDLILEIVHRAAELE